VMDLYLLWCLKSVNWNEYFTNYLTEVNLNYGETIFNSILCLSNHGLAFISNPLKFVITHKFYSFTGVVSVVITFVLQLA
jgi:hypothetical protein